MDMFELLSSSARAGVRSGVSLILLGLMFSGLLTADEPAPEQVWRFQVYVNDNPVGFHEYRMQHQGDQHRVSSEAEFEYKLMFVTLYNYQHQNQEIWQNGCLSSISSSTDANGKDFFVAGEILPEGFRLESNKGESVLPGCVKSFAYWNPQFLLSSRLLNSQNGEYVDVEISEPETTTLEVQGQLMKAHRFELTAKKLKVNLWYSLEGVWLGLEALYDNGRSLRYELVSQPTSLAAISVTIKRPLAGS